MSAFPKPLIIGHRGARGHAPENTMASFWLAHEYGAHAIELDTTLSGDGELVVIHDDTIDRTTDGKGAVGEMTVNELKQFDAGRWYHPRFEGERIPTLEEVLAQLPENFIINIEIKGSSGKLEERLAKLLVQYNRVETVFISSFRHKSLFYLKQLLPEIKVGLGYTADVVDHIAFARNFKLSLYSLHPHHALIGLHEIAEAVAQQIEVYPYTVNSPEKMKTLIEAGASGIITDYPDRMSHLLKARI
ncbi:glycerophosphodiester phosphodiesterase [Paenibacillaceae bacterium WGS1546]|uniref:glycerophosphodiester phosphodiesterase n=1 Tax=Cohnella sp. WGS1546 TaxID=3366810 RepID=UPI00372D1A16